MDGRNTTRRNRARARFAATRTACHICGQPIDYALPHLDPMSFALDHITPIARGGADDRSNYAASHRACNRAKSDKPHAPIVRRSPSLG